MSPQKTQRLLLQQYPGATFEWSGGGHMRLRVPGLRPITVSASPSDQNFLRQVDRDIRRQRRIVSGEWQKAGVAR